jgi:hypothetical protein
MQALLAAAQDVHKVLLAVAALEYGFGTLLTSFDAKPLCP